MTSPDTPFSESGRDPDYRKARRRESMRFPAEPDQAPPDDSSAAHQALVQTGPTYDKLVTISRRLNRQINMDILAHGLWTYAINRRPTNQRKWKWLILVGVFPDLVWLPYTAWQLVTTGHLVFSMGIYHWTHSLVIWAAASMILWLWRRPWGWLTWPWALHIIIDIPGHRDMLTPFLWPVSNFAFHGWWDWLSWPWLTATYIGLAIAVGFISRQKCRHQKAAA